jgi:hypothetical protein
MCSHVERMRAYYGCVFALPKPMQCVSERRRDDTIYVLDVVVPRPQRGAMCNDRGATPSRYLKRRPFENCGEQFRLTETDPLAPRSLRRNAKVGQRMLES